MEEKPTKQKRTRRPLTPETALGNILVTLAKLEPGERQRVLDTATTWVGKQAEG